MKKIIFYLLLLSSITTSFSQEVEPTDLPEFTGDNFSLEGALALFKQASSLEEFEKLINEEQNNVNNLDLNNDGEIDYIVVQDIQENDTHVIVLSTYLSEKEKQDIATIGIEKTGNETAILQIEGDTELFAENTIIEPFDVDEKIEKSKGGAAIVQMQPLRVVVNVWFWPSVRFLYAPGYRVWVSPHRWRLYPTWWKPWKPYRHSVFYGRCANHRVFYHRAPVRRVVVARKVYTPKRSRSTIVVHNKRGTTVIHKNKRGKTTVVKTKRRGRR